MPPGPAQPRGVEHLLPLLPELPPTLRQALGTLTGQASVPLTPAIPDPGAIADLVRYRAENGPAQATIQTIQERCESANTPMESRVIGPTAASADWRSCIPSFV